MPEYKLSDIRLEPYGNPTIPINYWRAVPLTSNGEKTVYEAREVIKAILDGKDPRKIVVLGPCSVHQVEAVKELVHRVKPLAIKYNDKLVIIVRECYEKPRTRFSWRGFIVDPNLKGQVNYHEGYIKARELLVYTVDLGLPVATEFVDSKNTPQIIADTISWAWIGARTVESPEHRGLASGLSMPTGMKNTTSGNIKKAIDAIVTAMHPDEFQALHPFGLTCPTPTKGNPYVHLVLRGGEETGPNYDRENVRLAQDMLRREGLRPNVLVDCSHDNTRNGEKIREYERQLLVAEDLTRQMIDGNKYLIGMMIEVHLKGGNVKLPQDLTSPNFNPNELPYGVSATDPCVPLEDTVKFLGNMYRSLRL